MRYLLLPLLIMAPLYGQVSVSRPKKIYAPTQNSTNIITYASTKEELLFLSAQANDAEKVKELLNEGVNPDSKDSLLRTPLMMLSDRNIEAAQILVGFGASVNIRDSFGNTPLIHVASGENINLVDLFLDNKAMINWRNKDGLTALAYAVQNGHASIVERLLKSYASTYVNYPNDLDLLSMAVIHGHTDIVRILLNKDKEPDKKILKSKTPLLGIASIYGHTEVARLLIRAGANVNLKNNQQFSPLLLAIIVNNIDIVELLLSNRANTSELMQNDGALWKKYYPSGNEMIETLLKIYS